MMLKKLELSDNDHKELISYWSIDALKINIDPNSIKPNRQNANNRSTRNLLKYIKIEVITY